MIRYDNPVVREDLKSILASTPLDWSQLRGKTVLITGVSGMLATYLAYTLYYANEQMDLDLSLIGTARNIEKAQTKFSGMSPKVLRLLQQDVTQPMELPDHTTVNFIVHAASSASPKYITHDPVGIIKANTLGTMNLLEFARTQEIDNFLFLSTREIYGKATKPRLGEQDYGGLDILSPRACYPESKRMGETLLKAYQVQYAIPFTTVRIAHSYGPGMEISNDGRIMNDLISNVVNGQNIILKSQGTAERAFCYLSDATAALMLALFRGENGRAYNVANEDEPIAIRDLATKLTELFPSKKLHVTFDIPTQVNSAYSTDGRTVMDMSAIEAMGWKRLISLDQGLLRTVESFIS